MINALDSILNNPYYNFLTITIIVSLILWGVLLTLLFLDFFKFIDLSPIGRKFQPLTDKIRNLRKSSEETPKPKAKPLPEKKKPEPKKVEKPKVEPPKPKIEEPPPEPEPIPDKSSDVMAEIMAEIKLAEEDKNKEIPLHTDKGPDIKKPKTVKKTKSAKKKKKSKKKKKKTKKKKKSKKK